MREEDTVIFIHILKFYFNKKAKLRERQINKPMIIGRTWVGYNNDKSIMK